MTTVKKVLGKLAALSLLPALALGIFASPAMAMQHSGVTSIATVTNLNSALVVNAVSVEAETGDNTANGGDAGDGGDSGDSGDNAGNGGNGGDGGEGGDAFAFNGDKTFAESGYGAEGGDGATGGDTGDTGDAGDGGYGGNGGQISTGDAFASLTIENNVNTNITDVTIEDDCGCDRYNEFYAEADTYYERSREATQTSDDNDRDDRRDRRGHHHHGDDDDDSTSSQSEWEVSDNHWEMYSKQFVPVTKVAMVTNVNEAGVFNLGSVEAETGDNTTNGGEGADGGDSGATGDDAGNGGDGGVGGDGGNAMAIGSNDNDHHDKNRRDRRHHHDNDDQDHATAIANSGAEGGNAGAGGDTGDTGDAGDGKSGGDGGLIVTGYADADVDIVDTTNWNVTREVL